MLLNANITAAQPVDIATIAKSIGVAQSFAGSPTQFMGSAEGKLSGAIEQIREALRLDRVPLVADRARQNERIDDKLAIAERRLFEALELVLKARAAVAPAEEA